MKLHVDVPVMKSCKSFFKLWYLQRFITGTTMYNRYISCWFCIYF